MQIYSRRSIAELEHKFVGYKSLGHILGVFHLSLWNETACACWAATFVTFCGSDQVDGSQWVAVRGGAAGPHCSQTIYPTSYPKQRTKEAVVQRFGTQRTLMWGQGVTKGGASIVSTYLELVHTQTDGQIRTLTRLFVFLSLYAQSYNKIKCCLQVYMFAAFNKKHTHECGNSLHQWSVGLHSLDCDWRETLI